MKNNHISEAGVSFENIVWSVYQDMGWRTYFLHMAANYRLNPGPRIDPFTSHAQIYVIEKCSYFCSI